MEINFEDILDKHIGVNTLLDLKKQLVLEAMKEVWNKAIDESAKELRKLSYPSSTEQEQQSILKLKV